MKTRIAFIGCGNMGEALLKGLIAKGLFNRPQITVSDKRISRLNFIGKAYRVKISASNIDAAKESDIIMLCVKPKEVSTVLEELGAYLKDKLIITIAAAIRIDYIRQKTGAKRIIRAMPNMPALAGCAVTAISSGKKVGLSDTKMADKIFGSVGKLVHLREGLMDAVTAVSGSGPAYFFLLMEAMMDAAASLGIGRAIAERLVAQTALGSAMLKDYLNAHPSVLRRRVTSKGGTTEAALKVFKEKGFEQIIKQAVRQAAKRSKQLSK